MITEQDLQEAIAECEGQRSPNTSTCIKLAAFYTIKNELFPKEKPENNGIPVFYSGSNGQDARYYSETEFGKLVNTKDLHHVLSVMDELMGTLNVLNPRLYAGVLRKLDEDQKSW